MLRGLLPAKLVYPDDSVSDSFVSFLDTSNHQLLRKLFSSAVEGNRHPSMPDAQGMIPIISNDKDTILSANGADKNIRMMYVCGMVAAGFSTKDSSLVDSQPRFLKPTTSYEEYITITYVLDPKSLEQKP